MPNRQVKLLRNIINYVNNFCKFPIYFKVLTLNIKLLQIMSKKILKILIFTICSDGYIIIL